MARRLGAATPAMMIDQLLPDFRLHEVDHLAVLSSSATRVVPELQRLGPGDILPGLPGAPPGAPPGEGFAVLRMREARTVVLGSPSLLPEPHAPGSAPPFQFTWSFVLEPIGDHATLLVVRARARFKPGLATRCVRAAIATTHQVMERAQLRNLQRRVEAAA